MRHCRNVMWDVLWDPADALLMLAGGPLPTAALNEMNFTRADTVLFKAAATRLR